MSSLPDRELLRIDEVAAYFNVTDRTVRIWIEHHHLNAEKLRGVIRVTRDSVVEFRLKSRLEQHEEANP